MVPGVQINPARAIPVAEDPTSPAMATAGCGSAVAGLVVKNNETLRAFLRAAAEDEQRLPSDLRDLASDLSSRSFVPYRSLRSVWLALPAGARPSITGLFSGVEFLLSSPNPREKSEVLKERLKKLAEIAERKEYEELVKDVAPRKEKAEPFSSYKDQLGFDWTRSEDCRLIPGLCSQLWGLHIVLIMFTGYLVGFTSFRALFNHSAVMNAAGGILGMVCCMLLETVLFIIRASYHDTPSSHSALKRKKHQ